MSRSTPRPVLPALALAAALLAGPGSAAAATLETIVEEVGFDADAAQRLRAGEILSKRIEESQEGTELAISVVGLFAASLEEAHASVVRGDAFEVDRNLLAHGELRAWPPDPGEFAGVEFTAQEGDEIAGLLDFRGGSLFNLSSDEIARFRGHKGRDAVNAAYREVLLGRYRAYREKGLPGLAPYDRGSGRVVQPAQTLRFAAEAANVLRESEPDVHRALSAYPAADVPDAKHFFFWLKQEVQGRPTFILSHRMLVQRPQRVVLVERQYFIGHTYNSVQIVTAALPVPEGVVVLYTSRTSIDQMAGMTGRVARPIAAERVAERVRSRFEALRAQKGSAP